MLSHLALPRDESVEEVALARAEAARAALDTLAVGKGADQDCEARRPLMREYQARLDACAQPGSPVADSAGLGALRREALSTERARLAALRHEERVGDDAFQRVEEELDWVEAELDGAGHRSTRRWHRALIRDREQGDEADAGRRPAGLIRFSQRGQMRMISRPSHPSAG